MAFEARSNKRNGPVRKRRLAPPRTIVRGLGRITMKFSLDSKTALDFVPDYDDVDFYQS